MSDQDRISSYNINIISSRQAMRIKNNISYGIINWFKTKFSKLTSQELYSSIYIYGELLINEILGVKGLICKNCDKFNEIKV